MASNAPDRFRFSPVGQWQTTDAGFWLTVTALNTNDQVVTGFAGTITLQAVGLEGSVTVEPVSFGPFTQGQHTAVVRVTTPGKAVRLNALEVPGESDGFNVGRPMFFEVSQPLMAGITWHEQSQTLFATVPSGAGQYANQLVAIDLGTGEVTNSYPLAPSPGQIEMSPEGQYLYTAVNNGLKLQRFNLTTRQAGVPFNIDSSHPDYTKSVYDFCVLAGTTDSVVIVGWDNFSMSSQNGGVWRFDGGRRTELQNFSATGGRFIQSLPSSAEVLLSPPLVKGQAQSGMPLSTAAQFCNGAAIYSDGRIYDQCGNFYSGATLEKLGSYPGVVSGAFYAGMMEVDPDAGRVFYFDGDQTWRTCYSLKAFDRDLCQLVARFDVAKPPARLIRCGTNGLAYLTGEGQLILVRPDLLQPSQAPVDLRVSLVPLLPQPVLGSNYPVLLTVSNAGPGTASVIRVTNNLPALATVIQTAASTGSVAVSSSGFAWYFTGLPAGSNATLEVTLRFGAAGWQTNRLWAIGFEKDPVITNIPVFASVDRRALYSGID